MSNFQQQVNNSKSLDELCDILNSFARNDNDDFSNGLSDAVDLCSLPTFGEYNGNCCEIFSWDNDHALIDNSSLCNGTWDLVPRCKTCGEPDFMCECECD